MLSHTIRKVFVAEHIIDFRKRLSGLLAEARSMDLDPYLGECIVFIHPSRHKIRVLCGDEYGAWILERFFEEGKLEQKFAFLRDPSCVHISHAELGMLLDGSAFVVNKRAKKYR